jgi:WhiB family redox-sensing transcriptional regulator
MSTRTWCEVAPSEVPCQVGDADLWFSEKRVDLERAKAMCVGCPIRRKCLTAALERHEPWGVWGGEIIERGTIAAAKRSRGRPRKNIEDSRHPKCAGRFGRILVPLRSQSSRHAP